MTLKPAFSRSSLAKGSRCNFGARTTLFTPRVVESTCRSMTTSGERFYGSAMTQSGLVTWGFTAHCPSSKSVCDFIPTKKDYPAEEATRLFMKHVVKYWSVPTTIRVGNVAYKVELPKKLKLHPIFHVSMLKPFQDDKEDPSRAESSRAPIGTKAAYDRDVEQILADWVVRKRWCKPKCEYLIKWKGLPESKASWEPAEDLWQFTKQIEAFYAEDDEGVAKIGGGECYERTFLTSKMIERARSR
ncbi:hypothetical protein CRG98_022572 [Punica granatum]|uniref:Chromo domain-containing protein n=1 Tax=Punica granatum TaxID=22663 RepID=A0A2I0JLB6_PUNGR|nr:hypothetical protein CRG98_022572 [Punica granatum]